VLGLGNTEIALAKQSSGPLLQCPVSASRSLDAAKEAETPQREELGVALPQQEGFLLFEGDN